MHSVLTRVLHAVLHLCHLLFLHLPARRAWLGSACDWSTPAVLCDSQVPVLRDALLKGKHWPSIAEQQKQQQFGAAAKALARQQLQTMMQSFELLCQIEEQREQQQKQRSSAAGGSSASGGGTLLERGGADELEVLQATVRVVCSRQVCIALAPQCLDEAFMLPHMSRLLLLQ